MSDDQRLPRHGEDGYVYKWEIEPHPQEDGASLVVDDDMEALEWLKTIAENVWDSMEPGEERTITIRMNET